MTSEGKADAAAYQDWHVTYAQVSSAGKYNRSLSGKSFRQIVADILQKAYAGGFAIKNRGYDTERVESSVFLANKGEMIRKQENQKYTKKPRLL